MGKPKFHLNTLFVVTVILTVAAMYLTMRLGETDLHQFLSKQANVANLFMWVGIISIYFQTREYKTYENIASNPVAVAAFIGSIIIATGIILAN